MYEVAICNRDGKVLRRFDLTQRAEADEAVKIGRAEDCDIKIRHATVSRHHCLLEPEDEETWVLRDAGSKGGCFVGGERVSEVEVKPGLEVIIGPAVLRFESVVARISAEISRELGEDAE